MKLSLSVVNTTSDEEGGGGAKLFGQNVYANESDSVKDEASPEVELGDFQDEFRDSIPPKPQARNEGGYFAMIPLPLSIITIVTAVWLIVGSILDMVLEKPKLADVIIAGYLVFFGFAIMLITVPTDFAFAHILKGPRSSLEKWARFIATNWGRGYFMLFICILAFSRKSWYRITIGILLIVNGVFSVWCGRLAAKKYNRLREYLAAGNEGNDFIRSIRGYAGQMMLQEGNLLEPGLKNLIEYSGRFVTNNEVHAIFCFFDRDRTGKVSLNSFIDRLVETPSINSM